MTLKYIQGYNLTFVSLRYISASLAPRQQQDPGTTIKCGEKVEIVWIASLI